MHKEEIYALILWEVRALLDLEDFGIETDKGRFIIIDKQAQTSFSTHYSTIRNVLDRLWAYHQSNIFGPLEDREYFGDRIEEDERDMLIYYLLTDKKLEEYCKEITPSIYNKLHRRCKISYGDELNKKFYLFYKSLHNEKDNA